MKRKHRTKIGICILAAVLLAGCGKPGGSSGQAAESSAGSGTVSGGQQGDSPSGAEEAAERQIFAMDTAMDITVYGEGADAAADAAVEEINHLDRMLSAESGTSEISRLNEAGEAVCSREVLELIARAREYWLATDGAFNICLYPVKKAWGFADRNYRVPDAAELRELLALADPEQIGIAGQPDGAGGDGENAGDGEDAQAEVRFGMKGMEIDLGGIAKGYASDRVGEILRAAGVKSAKINLGGNVYVIGSRPDGAPWRIGLQDPDGTHDYLGILEAEDAAVVTSGGYERYFEQDGKRYHHIIDPSTGYPAESGVVSATIVTRDATLADAFSTATFILGVEKSEELWKDSAYSFEMILLDTDGVVHVTEGLADSFDTEYEKRVIRKAE